MSYIQESSSWRDRKRHRQQATLAVVLLLLVTAGGVGYLVYSGRVGGPDTVDVTTLPPCPTATKKPLIPSQVVVNVYNATQRNGLANGVATTLDRRTFAVGKIANDPLRAKVPGPAVIRHGPKGLAGAQLLAGQVDGAKLVKDRRKDASVDFVIGVKFKNLKPLAEIATPSATPTCRPGTPSSTPSNKPSSKPATSKPATTKAG